MPDRFGRTGFDKLHADLGKAMLSINAVKAFELGSGFAGVEMKGSEHNDVFITEGQEVLTKQIIQAEFRRNHQWYAYFIQGWF